MVFLPCVVNGMFQVLARSQSRVKSRDELTGAASLKPKYSPRPTRPAEWPARAHQPTGRTGQDVTQVHGRCYDRWPLIKRNNMPQPVR